MHVTAQIHAGCKAWLLMPHQGANTVSKCCPAGSQQSRSDSAAAQQVKPADAAHDVRDEARERRLADDSSRPVLLPCIRGGVPAVHREPCQGGIQPHRVEWPLPERIDKCASV